MKGFVYVRRGKVGRLKLAAIRPTIKEAIEIANSYEKRELLVPFLMVYVKDENNITYQSTTLRA
jgi:hypothetical protein